MSKSKYWFQLSSFFLIFLSCQNDSDRIQESIYIIPEIRDELIIDQFANDIEIVLLDNQALLSYPKQLLSTDSFYFLTSHNRGFIFKFDKLGNLISTIKPTGPGPMELGSIDYFAKGENINTFLICDISSHRISVYNIKTDSVINEFYTGEYPPFSCTFKGGYIYFLTNDFTGGRVKKLDYNTGKIVDEFVFGPSTVNTVQTVNPFYQNGNSIFVGLSLTDTIYKIENNQVTPILVLGNEEHLSIDTSTYDIIRIIEQKKPLPSMYEIYPPNGFQSTIGEIIGIPLALPRTQSHLWYHTKKHRLVKMERSNFKYQRVFCRQTISFKDFDGKYAYNYFFMEPEFYEDARKYIKEKDDVISERLIELLEAYPEDEPYQNPILVKIKVNPNLDKFIFGK